MDGVPWMGPDAQTHQLGFVHAHVRIQVAERYAQLVGQQGEELTLLRTAEQEAARAHERNDELEGTGKRECVYVCEKLGRPCRSMGRSA